MMKLEPIETTILKNALKLSGLIYSFLGQEEETKIAKTILQRIEGAEDESKRERIAKETGQEKPQKGS
jgi:hypothetical protein